MHIDEKFKDANPIDTVNRIKKILSDFDISVTEEWNESGITSTHSLQLCVEGTKMFSNGKGVTPELATASAYAEFIERLQSGFMKMGELKYSDTRDMTAQELMEESSDILSIIASRLKELSGSDYSLDKLISGSFTLADAKETVECIPYYDVNNKRKVYLPTAFVKRLYSTNGLAAGNSPEEAMVQGFAEVVERYCLNSFYFRHLTPPTVPDEFLRKFKTSYEIITAVRNAGYDIEIKDCSLGNGYPVVAAVLIDKKTHSYHVHLGASPVFEIALERSLTETFQGRNISGVTKVKNVLARFDSTKAQGDMFTSYRIGDGAYPVEFFFDTPSYEFTEPEDLANSNNKHLLKKSLDFARKMGWEVLVRDVSHLGFNDFKILIPGVSEVYYTNIVGDVPVISILNELKNVRRNITKATAEELFMFRLMYHSIVKSGSTESLYSVFTKIPVVPDKKEDLFLGRMFLAYIEWKLGNKKRAYELAASGEAIAVREDDKEYLSAFNRMYDVLAKGYPKEDILNFISLFYNDSVVSEINDVYSGEKNPFEKYIADCSFDNCSGCRYVNTCTAKTIAEYTDRLNSYVSVFDNDAAFEQIRSVFESIES